MNRKSLLRKTCLTIALGSYLALGSTIAQNKADTLKLYASKKILELKGKTLGLNGEGLRIFEIGNASRESIYLSRIGGKGLIEVFVVIDYLTNERRSANFYLSIDGQKHRIDLSCYLAFESKYDKQKHYVLSDGQITSKYMHCDHYSHASHRSHISSSQF